MQFLVLGTLRQEIHRLHNKVLFTKKQTETKECYGRKRFYNDHRFPGSKKMCTLMKMTSLILVSEPAALQLQPSLDPFPSRVNAPVQGYHIPTFMNTPKRALRAPPSSDQ